MKTASILRKLAAIIIFVALPIAANAYVKNEITQVDAAAGTVTISNGKGGFATYHTAPSTGVVLNGKTVTLEALTPGMTAMVSSAGGTASRIDAATNANPDAGSSTATAGVKEQNFHVPGASSRAKPVVVGTVKAGQQITIVSIRSHWCGGGTKKGVFCDWNGYPDKRDSGHQWMALVASVGKTTFAPKNNVLTFTAPEDGLLALYANDDKPEDNEGSGDFTVTVESK